jgi:hypothetical protein
VLANKSGVVISSRFSLIPSFGMDFKFLVFVALLSVICNLCHGGGGRECPKAECTNQCTYGYRIDKYNCQTCECNPIDCTSENKCPSSCKLPNYCTRDANGCTTNACVPAFIHVCKYVPKVNCNGNGGYVLDSNDCPTDACRGLPPSDALKHSNNGHGLGSS